jgi:SSS family solute:Na+ symporter
MGLINEWLINKLSILYQDEYSLIRATLILVISTILSLLVTLLTKPVDSTHLIKFYKKIRPRGFWGPISNQVKNINNSSEEIRNSWMGFTFGVLFLNSILFSVGHLVIGNYLISFLLLIIGFIFGRFTILKLEKAFTINN